MKSSLSTALAMIAGTAVSASAYGQRSMGSRPAASGRPIPAQAQLAGRATPDAIRAVRIVNGQIVPVSDWVPYSSPHGDTAPQYVFDNVQDTPGVTPGTLPATGRYLFGWVAGGPRDFTTAVRTFDMAGIPAAAQGQGATVCDIMYRENNAGIPLFITIVTAETFVAAAPPTDPSWGAFPGIQAAFNTGVGIGFWFTSVDVAGQPPPVGDGWRMPVDGAGAYTYFFHRDAAGTMAAQGVQPGCWGTGNYAQPPVARVGTQGLIGHADTSTPPQCGAINLATNISNGIVETACETNSWNYAGQIAAPDPTTLAPAIGFGMKVQVTGACCIAAAPCQVVSPTACAALNGVYQGDNTTCAVCQPVVVCYPNCDNSTVLPCLNVTDFGCFINRFQAGDSYANCDGSTVPPVLNVSDFGCFINRFQSGCSAC